MFVFSSHCDARLTIDGRQVYIDTKAYIINKFKSKIIVKLEKWTGQLICIQIMGISENCSKGSLMMLKIDILKYISLLLLCHELQQQ